MVETAVVIVVNDSYAPLYGPVTVPGLMAPAFAALVVEGAAVVPNDRSACAW